MKKIYASMLAFGVVFGASAQVAQQQVQQIKVQANQNTVALGQPIATPSVAATGDTIGGLYYDFSTPGNWTVSNTSTPAYDWQFVTAMPAGLVGGFGATFNSGSGGTFAISDSDTEGDGSTQDCYLQLANPVDLSGQASVAVAWTQYAADFYDENFIEVSNDGGANWTAYEVNASLSPNDATDNPDYMQVNISAVAGNESSVLIRFHYVAAWGYFWAIDDVVFVEAAGNDLDLTDVWHGDIVGAFEYQQVPLAQAQEVVIGATCTNIGGNAQTNAIYTYDISDGSTSVASGTFPANNISIAPVAADTTWYTTGFIPSSTGTYTVTVSVASDLSDESPANNDGESVFMVSDNIYAHDDADNVEFILTGIDANGDIPEFKMGLYYETTVAANLIAVQVAFGRLTRAESCIVEVFDANDLTNALVTEVYDIQPADVSTGNGVTILTDILIDGGDGFQLDADGLYLISIGNSGANDSLYIEASAGDDDRAQLRYGPFGVGGAVNWYTGYTTSPIIRAKFDPSVGIEENEDVTSVSIYPNPTSDNVNINFVSKEDQDITINVISVDGSLVFAKNLNTKVGQASRTSVDVSNLSSGIYMVQLMGANSSLTQRIVVQ